MNEHEPFAYDEEMKAELNELFDSKREADWDHIDLDIEYQKRELKRIGGNIDELPVTRNH